MLAYYAERKQTRESSSSPKGRGWGGNVNMNFEEALYAQERRYPTGNAFNQIRQ